MDVYFTNCLMVTEVHKQKLLISSEMQLFKQIPQARLRERMLAVILLGRNEIENSLKGKGCVHTACTLCPSP